MFNIHDAMPDKRKLLHPEPDHSFRHWMIIIGMALTFALGVLIGQMTG